MEEKKSPNQLRPPVKAGAERLAAMGSLDLLGRDLGRDTHSHRAAVFNAHQFSRTETAGLAGVDQDLLTGGAVTDHQPIGAFRTNYAGCHCGVGYRFQGHNLPSLVLQSHPIQGERRR